MTNTTSKQSGEAKNPPVAKVKIGLNTASVWARPTDKGTFYSVTFQRNYRDGDNKWHSTPSFNEDDLLVVAKLADAAHTRILTLRVAAKAAAAAAEAEDADLDD